MPRRRCAPLPGMGASWSLAFRPGYPGFRSISRSSNRVRLSACSGASSAAAISEGTRPILRPCWNYTNAGRLSRRSPSAIHSSGVGRRLPAWLRANPWARSLSLLARLMTKADPFTSSPRPKPHDAPPRHPAEVEVLIVGSGFSGICMGVRLLRAGIESFLIIEKAEDLGGTWRDNRYPGCACDIPSHLYSLSFAPRSDWRRMYPSQPELWEYLRD